MCSIRSSKVTVVGSGALVCVRLDQSDSAGSVLVCACVWLQSVVYQIKIQLYHNIASLV